MLDAAGRLRSIINPLGQKTVYTPDALDRTTQLTDAINGVTQFGYDPNSNLLTVTDAKSHQTVYTPNNMNRITSRKDPLLNTETYTYDNNGNLATSTDAGVTTTYTWNARNQLTTISGPGLTWSFTYNSFGRRTGRTVNGTTTNFVYDGLNPVQEKNGAIGKSAILGTGANLTSQNCCAIFVLKLCKPDRIVQNQSNQ
ncbi:MAG: RHS repeat protein [Nitrospira sp.]|nr:RHS repeat protein [Nitrospira sp.]